MGIIGGLCIVIISEEDSKNLEMWNEIYEKNPEAKKEVEMVLERKGLIYGVVRDGNIEAIFVFNRTNHTEEIELKYISTYHTEQCKNIIITLKSRVINKIKKDVSIGKISKVELEDKVLTTKGMLYGNNMTLFWSSVNGIYMSALYKKM